MLALLFGLLSVLAFSLFLSTVSKRSASAMPLVSLCIAMLWFSIFGMLNLLWIGGLLWYILSFLSLVWCIWKERKNLLLRISPAFGLFALVSLFMIILLGITKPMFVQWDEFTFWGAACKATSNTNQLYTVAQSNLIARSYQPGLIVLSYMMQFFSGSFIEYGAFVAFAILYFASFAAAASMWDKNKAGTVVLFAVFASLPFLFTRYQTGVVNFAYVNCMADVALGCLFGGVLSFHFVSKEKTQSTLLFVGVMLAALTNIKDIGLALAGIAWLIILCDILFCEYKTVVFFTLKKWKATIVYGLYSLACIGIPFLLWNQYILRALQQDRTNLGSGGSGGMSQLEMMIVGIKALLRIQPDGVFDDRATKMVQGFFGKYQGAVSSNFQVWLFGSAFRMLLLILAILAVAWLLAAKPLRKKIVVFIVTSMLGALAYGIFLTFTYTYVFQGGESETLKDYARYTMPYWFGWLMTSLVILGNVALQKVGNKKSVYKPLFAKSAVLVVSLFVLGTVALRTNWQASFLQISPSLYGTRNDVKSVVSQAQQEGMQADDVVYLISQGDNASRFYLFSYELEDEKLSTLYKAPSEKNDWSTSAEIVPEGTTAASLVPVGGESGYAESAVCTPEDLLAYLKAKGCTHILLDVSDGYIQEDFSSLFSDSLAGWGEDGEYENGNRYYEIVWQGDTAQFVPVSSAT